MANVYFFSRHEAQEAMVADLGGITEQFRGSIKDIRGAVDEHGTKVINFTESPLPTKEEQEAGVTPADVKWSIPADSIVVAVAPLPLQIDWMKAGVATFLVPQNNRVVLEDKSVVFNYAGLLHIKSIVVESEQWAGAAPTVEQKHSERSAL
jgi:hypothetical protein